MSKDLQNLPTTNFPECKMPTVFTQIGDDNIQIAQASNVNNVINVFVPGTTGLERNDINTSFTLNTEYYNLFVIGNETFNDSHFIVPKERTLTESILPETAAKFARLSDDAISQIKSFPCLFASENYKYGKTDQDHIAFFGFITDIRVQENGIKIYFHKLSPIQQQKLNEIAFEIGLESASAFNELNRTHWTIKKIDLIEELKTAGISVLAPT